MAHAYHHSISSTKKFGGQSQDYIEIHKWFDETKHNHGDFRHRAIRHHATGIGWCEDEFGLVIANSDGRIIPVRWIAEQHIIEDCGRIPSMSDWVQNIPVEPWMNHSMPLSKTE